MCWMPSPCQTQSFLLLIRKAGLSGAVSHLAYWCPLGCGYVGPWWEMRGERKGHGVTILVAPTRRHFRLIALLTQQDLILSCFFQSQWPRLPLISSGVGLATVQLILALGCLLPPTASVISCLVQDSSSNYCLSEVLSVWILIDNKLYCTGHEQ